MSNDKKNGYEKPELNGVDGEAPAGGSAGEADAVSGEELDAVSGSDGGYYCVAGPGNLAHCGPGHGTELTT